MRWTKEDWCIFRTRNIFSEATIALLENDYVVSSKLKDVERVWF